MDIESLLHQLKTESDLEVRRYIPDKLAKLGNWRSTKPLGAIVVDISEPVLLRNEAVESLGKQGDPRSVKYLETAVKDPDAELRRTAVWSLGQVGVLEAFDIIIQLANDENDQVQRWIPKSLVRIAHPKTAEFLQTYWKQFPDTEIVVRADILRAASDFLHTDNIEFWYNQAISLLATSIEMKLLHPAAIMVQSCVSLNPELDTSQVKNLVVENRSELQNVRGILFEAIGYTDSCEFLNKFLESEFSLVIGGIAHCANTKLLETQFTNFSNLSGTEQQQLLAAIATSPYLPEIETLTHLFNTGDLQLKQQVLAIFSHHQMRFDLVKQQYETQSGKYGVLKLMGNYNQSFDILIDEAKHGDKVARQIAVDQLKSPVFTNNSSLKQELIATFEFVNANDPIWHIRRDARKGIETLKMR